MGTRKDANDAPIHAAAETLRKAMRPPGGSGGMRLQGTLPAVGHRAPGCIGPPRLCVQARPLRCGRLASLDSCHPRAPRPPRVCKARYRFEQPPALRTVSAGEFKVIAWTRKFKVIPGTSNNKHNIRIE